MCSVSWLYEKDGYTIVSNRDELRSRLPAAPPVKKSTGKTTYLAPVDGDAGGTWIAVDDGGNSYLLLNYYPADYRPASGDDDYQSRGQIIHSFISDPDHFWSGCDLRSYKPFDLVVFSMVQQNKRFRWSGETLEITAIEDSCGFVTTSSINDSDVREIRTETFKRITSRNDRIDECALLSALSSHEPEKGGNSICMHRQDAKTFCCSIINVREGQARFHYIPHSPCKGTDGVTSFLSIGK